MNVGEFYEVIYTLIDVEKVKTIVKKSEGIDNTIYVELKCGKEYAVQVQELNCEIIDWGELKRCPFIRKETDKLKRRIQR